MAYFVWIKGPNGTDPTPARFDEWPTVNGKPLVVLQEHEVSGRDLNCRLKHLVKKYPYKVKDGLS